MASLLSPRRTQARLSLTATEPQLDPGDGDESGSGRPAYAWLVAAIGGAVLVLLVGWVLVAGVTVVGWLAGEPGTLADSLRVGTELWLLGNGVGARLGTTTVTLVPWGVTLLVGATTFHVAGFAAKLSRDRPGRAVSAVTLVTAITYLGPLVVTALVFDHAAGAVRGGLTMAGVISLAAAWGSCKALGFRPTAGWPAWSRSIPRAVIAAQLVLLAVGAALFATSALLHLEQIEHLLVALRAGVAGHIALLLLQLAYAPNVIVWSTAYALGPGFTLGPGTLVAPVGTQVDTMPGVPMFGALPEPGTGDPLLLLWLAGGVLAGVIAAVVVVRARPAARFDETTLVGALAGVASALVFVGLAWLSSGDLGSAQLAGLGPRIGPLIVMAPVMLGLSGAIAGLALGLIRLARHRSR